MRALGLLLTLSFALTACGDPDAAAGVGAGDDVGGLRDVRRDDRADALGADTIAAGDSDAPPSDTAPEETTAGDPLVAVDIAPPDTDADAALDVADDVPGPIRGGLVSAEPSSIYFSYAAEGELFTEEIHVANGSDASVVLLRAELVDAAPGFVVFDDPVNRALAPGEVFTFSLRFESTGAPSASAELRIFTDSDQVLVIPITAAEKAGGPTEEPPCVTVVPRRLDFGPVARGTVPPPERTFAVTNCGTSDINLLRLDRASSFIFVTPVNFQWASDRLPVALPPGASTTVRVTYTAGRAGRQTGGIDVRTNVTGSETIRVELAAESLAPPIEDLDLHLLLRWDQPAGSDVDFHFLPAGASLNSGQDCYYANMAPDWGVRGDVTDDPFLDIDDLEGPGPENINVDELGDGTYQIVVYYYSDTGSGGGGGGGSSVPANATVEVRIAGALVATYGPTLLRRTGATWTVATLDWPSATLTEVGTVTP